MVWTTNFDALIEDACAKAFDTTSALTTIDLESATSAHQSIAAERWPIQVKLHGDFRFRQLKNTPDELRQQDAHLRRSFIDSCKRYGIAVCGYSGRDDSVMDALDDAVAHHGAFPNGLFWLHRGEDSPLPRVASLLEHAVQSGIDAAMVRIENFDEILRDLVRIVESIDKSALQQFVEERSPWTPAPRVRGGRGWPVVRLNALPLTKVPIQCRRIVCDVGGTAEVREVVRNAGRDVLAVRSGVGVLGFGADSDMRAVFESRGIVDFDLHPLDVRRQRYESTERGLLGEALNRALERHRGLRLVTRDGLVPACPEDPAWRPLKKLVGTLTGVVAHSPDLRWHEGITVRLGWANDQLWLLVEPRTVFSSITEANRKAAADFARERTVRRYNSVLNALFDFWAHHLSQDDSDMRALNTHDGIDAVFQLSSVTAFSRRRTP
ncbi:MAG: SIR2 family protein [Spirochaetaceae bacterium]|nr:SIR2 family protein [Spirochaetaceae bacterium]